MGFCLGFLEGLSTVVERGPWFGVVMSINLSI